MYCPVCHSELRVASSFCPFCGTRLEWAGAPPQVSASSRHVGTAVGLIALLVLGGLFASGFLVPAAIRLYDDAKNLLRNLACFSPALCTNSTFPTTTGKATYDQQVSMIFSQNLPAINYNVTAIAQTDTAGYGPAYLLNGLSDAGYWYQVGLAYNWPLATGTSYDAGFHFIWEVFTPNGTTNNPVLSRTPDSVNNGDIVGLSLSFQTGTNSVTLTAVDYNTGASATHTYTAAWATIFVGSSNPRSSRTPTSLMTEWYHSSAYETSMKQVTYSAVVSTTNSAWICFGEYVPPNPNTLVYAQCSSLLTLNGQLQPYSYQGLNTYASQTEFKTGPS